MKTSIIKIATLSILLSACVGKEAPQTADSGKSPHAMATEMFESRPFPEVIALQEQAVKELREGRSRESGFDVLSQMGYFLCRAGNYMEGLRYLQEAEDSLWLENKGHGNPDAVVKLMGNLANLYTRFGLHDEALRKNREAISYAEKYMPNRLADVWRMRGTLFDHQPDSQLMCLRRAVEATELIEGDSTLKKNSRTFCLCNKAWFYIENPDFAPDSIAAATTFLENVNTSQKFVGTNTLLAGRGHVLMGNPKKGLPMMEKGIDFIRKTQDPESLQWGLRLLSDSYARARDPKLFEIFAESTAWQDTIMERRRNDALLGQDFRYRSSKLRSENQLLKAELDLTHQRAVYLTLIGILIAVIAVIVICHRVRLQRRKISEMEDNIKALLEERISLNKNIEALNARLSERVNAEEEPELMLKPVLLTKDEEARFRFNFIGLHPDFIGRLHADCPELTAGNELMCMMIALKMTNDEIALALGISRESVVTARYRLRTRFHLPKETDLNDYIRGKL